MEEFNKITAEPLVLTPLPDKSMLNLVRLKQRLQLLDQTIGCSWRFRHQILSPVQQPHIGTEGPSVQGIVNVVPQTGPWHETGHIRFAEPRVKWLQPTGCNELGEPGDIHQQSIEGGRSEQQAADGQIGDLFGVPRSAGDLELNTAAVVCVEARNLLAGGIGKGCGHQDADPLRLMDRTPADPCGQNEGTNECCDPTQQAHQPTPTTSGKPESCSSAQSLTV